MNYFISDLHFGHENCLLFDNRPFEDIDIHDTELINRWNNVVGIDDDVYILGDISWRGAVATTNIFKMLNGHKHLIIGNHDHKLLKNRELRNEFVEITNYKELQISEDGTSIVLSHYPILAYNNLFRGWYHLYGHVHSSFEWNMMEHHKMVMKNLYSKKDGKNPDDVFEAYNVGCMIPYMDYTPRTLEEIITLANSKTYII